MNLTYFHSHCMQAVYKLNSNTSCLNEGFMNLCTKFWNLTLTNFIPSRHCAFSYTHFCL